MANNGTNQPITLNDQTAPQRAFKGIWIPADLWASKDVTIQEKIILLEINSLTHVKKKYCWARNKHFADFFGLSIQRISQILNKLKKQGIIEITEIFKGKQVIERRLTINEDAFNFLKAPPKNPLSFLKAPPKNPLSFLKAPLKVPLAPPLGTFKDSNTIQNNTILNKSFSNEKHNRGLCDTSGQGVEQEGQVVESENISSNTIILDHWKSLDGKVHKNKSAKGFIKINHMIDELLIEGLNPYSKLTDDPKMKIRKWEVQEIVDSINYYVTVLRKDISKTYFNEFVVLNYFSKQYKNSAPNHSPLVEAFKQIKFIQPTKKSEKLKSKLTSAINGNEISEKVFIKAANYLARIDKAFKVTNAACITLNKSMLKTFTRYVKEKKNNADFKLEYIAGDTFKKEFVEEMQKRNVIVKRKLKRKRYANKGGNMHVKV